MKATTPKQVLAAAKWILQHHGWCQGNNYQSKDGRLFFNPEEVKNDPSNLAGCCLNGALQIIDTEGGAFIQAYGAVYKELGTVSIGEWNDTPGRIKEEVLAVLDRAIEKV